MSHRIQSPIGKALITAVLSCALVTPLLAAPVYQWRDAKGVMHFGDTPPPSARDVRLRQGGAARLSAIGDAEPDANAAPAIDAAACERKRAQLAGYRQASTISETNALGVVREYSDADRQVLIAATEAQVRAACGEDAEPAP